MQTETAANPAPGFAKHPGHRITLTPAGRRIRVWLGSAAFADSARVRVMREGDYPPVYYFPREDVRMELLERTDHETFCPFKGEASYWSLAAGGRREQNAAWSYEDPFDQVAGIKDYLAFYTDRVEWD